MRSKGAMLAAFLIFLLYALFLTKTYYWDGVLFSFYVEQAHRGEMPFTSLFHPNHLLYSPFAYLLSTVVWKFAPTIRALYILQVANAGISAVCSWLVFQLARRVLASELLAWFAMLLFASGATWWKFSTDANTYVVSVFFCLMAVSFALRGNLTGAVACHTAAMLFHELAVFLFFPIALAFLRRRGWRVTALFMGLSAFCTGAIYWLVYAISPHTGFIGSWITSYAGDTPVTHTLRQVLSGYLGSYLKLFAGGKFSLARQFMGVVLVVSLLACLFCIAIGIRLWTNSREAQSRTTRDIPILLAWFIPLALFLAVFDPASTFHKLFIWPPLVLLLCSCVPRAREAAFLALGAALACWNFGLFIWPHSHEAADPVLGLARRIDHELPANAVIYYEAFSPDDWYLRYFGPNHVWKQLPVPPQATGPVCFETTAFNAQPRLWASAQPQWTLVTPQHDIRVGCLRSH